jgi:arylsulfatase A-like enzyme
VLLGWGKRARVGAAAPADADMYDVAATLYALAGLPLALDFAGEPVDGLFDLPAAPPPVASYVLDPRGKPYRAEKPAAPLSPSDRAATEQLEALGYLDAKGRPAAPLSHGASAPEGPPRPHPR